MPEFVRFCSCHVTTHTEPSGAANDAGASGLQSVVLGGVIADLSCSASRSTLAAHARQRSPSGVSIAGHSPQTAYCRGPDAEPCDGANGAIALPLHDFIVLGCLNKWGSRRLAGAFGIFDGFAEIDFGRGGAEAIALFAPDHQFLERRVFEGFERLQVGLFDEA